MSLDSILRATGKNLFDISNVTGFVNSSGNIMSENNMKIQNGSIIANFGAYGQSCMTKEYVYLSVGTYTISADVLIDNANANPVYIGLYELDKKINLNKATAIPLNQTTRVSATVNVVKNGNYHILTQGSGNVSQYINLNAVFSNIQIEKGSTATDYEPFRRILQSVKMPSNGENLTPYPYEDSDKTENGITFLTGYYSGITINGATDLSVGYIVADNLDLTAGNYTFSSGCNSATIPNGVMIQLCYLENGSVKGLTSQLSGSKLQETFSIDDTIAQKKFRVVIVLNQDMSDSFSVNDLVFLPTLVKSENKEVLKVSYNSKNLLPYPWADTTKTQNGITFTDNRDGSLTISGTATAETYFILQRGKNYGSQPINAMLTESATNGEYAVSKRIFYNSNSKVLSVNILKGATINETIYPQIELGTTATDHVSYYHETVWVKEATN